MHGVMNLIFYESAGRVVTYAGAILQHYSKISPVNCFLNISVVQTSSFLEYPFKQNHIHRSDTAFGIVLLIGSLSFP
jgi:hypothetical protein